MVYEIVVANLINKQVIVNVAVKYLTKFTYSFHANDSSTPIHYNKIAHKYRFFPISFHRSYGNKRVFLRTRVRTPSARFFTNKSVTFYLLFSFQVNNRFSIYCNNLRFNLTSKQNCHLRITFVVRDINSPEMKKA